MQAECGKKWNKINHLMAPNILTKKQKHDKIRHGKEKSRKVGYVANQKSIENQSKSWTNRKGETQ
jgi:hypothetical protein